MEKKHFITIGAGVGAGIVSKGAVGMLDLGRTTKIVVCLALAGGAMYGAATVKSGQNALQGAYTGVAMVQTLEALREIANTDAVKAKLDTTTKLGQFGSKALGLSAALEYDDQGNYLPSGNDGLGRYNELDGLGFADDNFDDNDGLGFADDNFDDNDGLGFSDFDDDNDGLGYSVEEEQMYLENE